MAGHLSGTSVEIGFATSKAGLIELIGAALDGATVDKLDLLDPAGQERVALPSDKTFSRPLEMDGHLVLVQDDGSVIVLIQGADNPQFVLESDAGDIGGEDLLDAAKEAEEWDLLEDADLVDLSGVVDLVGQDPAELAQPEGSGSAEQVDVVNPLIGLPISPLLPPIGYSFPEFLEEDTAGGTPPGDIVIAALEPAAFGET
ncbi:MAG: hypothetical protein AAFX00_04915, partial [Pseudomonadota bacterium]